jgi:hypothetical protein
VTKQMNSLGNVVLTFSILVSVSTVLLSLKPGVLRDLFVPFILSSCLWLPILAVSASRASSFSSADK